MNSKNISRRQFIKVGGAGFTLSVCPYMTKLKRQEQGNNNETIRIAIIQQETVPGAVDKNRAKAFRFARKVLNRGADIILFHEGLLVGYVENFKELAEEVNGSTTQAFQVLLQGTDALVLYGLTERKNENYYISATLVGGNGVVANYRKTHLWWNAQGLRNETVYYQQGNELVTFNVKGYKSGVMICYDGDFPEMTRAYANLGCTMLFWLNNRGSRGHREVRRLARMNSMIMATSCCCGRNERGEFCRGGTNITDSDGTLISEIWNREGVIYANVVPDKVVEDRKRNPWFRGQRRDLYC